MEEGQMRIHPTRPVFSYLFITTGALLLFFGARDLIESRVGQTVAASEMKTAPPVDRAVEVTPRPGEAIAKLKIPRLSTELYVVEGDNTPELRRGPGHITGTAMPGGNGNCVIAGHRDTHFRVLKDIRQGDDVVLETRTGQFLYRITSTHIVSPNNTDPLRRTAAPELSLVTCYPFYYVGDAPKRFIVQAALAGAVDAAAN
jgi:sortase A